MKKSKIDSQVATLSLSRKGTISNAQLKQIFEVDQSQGCSKSHFIFFKQVRDEHLEKIIIKTNKLLTTLERLITIDSNSISDETKRDCEYFVYEYYKLSNL